MEITEKMSVVVKPNSCPQVKTKSKCNPWHFKRHLMLLLLSHRLPSKKTNASKESAKHSKKATMITASNTICSRVSWNSAGANTATWSKHQERITVAFVVGVWWRWTITVHGLEIASGTIITSTLYNFWFIRRWGTFSYLVLWEYILLTWENLGHL